MYCAELEAAQRSFSSVGIYCLITVIGGIGFRAEWSGMGSYMSANQIFHHAAITATEHLHIETATFNVKSSTAKCGANSNKAQGYVINNEYI